MADDAQRDAIERGAWFTERARAEAAERERDKARRELAEMRAFAEDGDRVIAEALPHVTQMRRDLTTTRAELDRVREERDAALRERDAYSAQIRADLQDAPRREREWLGAPTPEVHETARAVLAAVARWDSSEGDEPLEDVIDSPLRSWIDAGRPGLVTTPPGETGEGRSGRRCAYCGRAHPVSDAVAEENPFCNSCLHERVEGHATPPTGTGIAAAIAAAEIVDHGDGWYTAKTLIHADDDSEPVEVSGDSEKARKPAVRALERKLHGLRAALTPPTETAPTTAGEEWRVGGPDCDHPSLPEFIDGALRCKHCNALVDKMVQRQLDAPDAGEERRVRLDEIEAFMRVRVRDNGGKRRPSDEELDYLLTIARAAEAVDAAHTALERHERARLPAIGAPLGAFHKAMEHLHSTIRGG